MWTTLEAGETTFITTLCQNVVVGPVRPFMKRATLHILTVSIPRGAAGRNVLREQLRNAGGLAGGLQVAGRRGFNVVTTLKSSATQHQGVNLSPPRELRPLSPEEC